MISIVRLLKFLKNTPYYLPSWELTYSTLGSSENHLQKGQTVGDMLVPWRVASATGIREADSFGAKKILALEGATNPAVYMLLKIVV